MTFINFKLNELSYLYSNLAFTVCLSYLSSFSSGYTLLFKITNFFYFTIFYLFLESGEGGRKRGRKTPMYGCLLHDPHWGPGLQSRRVPWVGIKSATFRFAGLHSIPWATPARAKLLTFIFIKVMSVFGQKCQNIMKLNVKTQLISISYPSSISQSSYFQNSSSTVNTSGFLFLFFNPQ